MPSEAISLTTADPSPATGVPVDPFNVVRLVGTVADPGEHRLLAGGAQVVRWALRVPRTPERAGSDLIDCVALEPDLQEQALLWPVGLTLAVSGAIRRRFFRSAGRTATRVEVEAFEVTAHPSAEPESSTGDDADDGSAAVSVVDQPNQ